MANGIDLKGDAKFNYLEASSAKIGTSSGILKTTGGVVVPAVPGVDYLEAGISGLDSVPIGESVPASGKFTTLTSTGGVTLGDAEATDTHAIKGATTLLANSASAALTVTQTGAGNAFVVEDSTSPDSTSFVIDSAGRTYIGGTTGNEKLNVTGAILSNSSSTNFAQDGVQVDYATDAGRISAYKSTGSSISFWTNPNGGANAKQVEISSIGLVTLTAGQIKFPATQNASADANTLDDYEEGTFTPVLRDAAAGNAATAGTSYGAYTKIGDTVHFALKLYDINTTGLTAGNAVFVSGLPFAAMSANGEFTSTVRVTNTTTTTGAVLGFLTSGVSAIQIMNGTTTGSAVLFVSALTSTTADMWITGTYKI